MILANQQARNSHQPPLGWINPSLYKLAANGSRAPIFRDVLTGGNDLGTRIGPKNGGNNKPMGCCSAGPDFDAASGWGSVTIQSFSNALRALPSAR